MKKALVTIICTLFFTWSGWAQNCNSPVSNVIFQSNFNQIAIQSSNQLKLDKSLAFVNNHCLMAAQIKNIALLFSEDSYRLEFCKVAYLHLYDKANFYDVYDAFSTFSNAFRLNDFVHQTEANSTASTATTTTSTVVQAQVNTKPAEPTFPNYAYPSVLYYKGHMGCSGPVISENVFGNIVKRVYAQPTEESKSVAIQQSYEQNCLSMAHMMKLCHLVQSENLRLRILMNSFSRIYDQDHYQSPIVLFSSTELQNEWTTYASAYLAPPPPVCETSDADFKKILEALKAKHFSDEKFNTLELASKNKCFTVTQIKTISKEFSFGSEKLKAFKMLYAKCNNKDDYYMLIDELTFPSEKEDLSEFIRNDGK